MKNPKPTKADEPLSCPHCKVSLLGEPLDKFIKGVYGNTGNYWKREIGVEIPQEYDGVYFWLCPDCKGEWGGYRAMKK